MSSLTPIEKRTLERLLEMGGGYVLNFSNRTFEEFFLDALGVAIYDPKYDYASGSKANRMRGFWKVAPDHVVARALSALIEYAETLEPAPDPALVEKAQAIIERLKVSAPVQDLDALTPNADGRDFEILAKSVRDSIESNEPEVGLDHLHTFVVRYVRELCRREGIEVSPKKPLHSLFGELRKALKARGLIESEMADRILKSTISILDAFNDVRNNRSLAHDNSLLTYPEALLIFNNVASAIRFLSAIVEEAQTADATVDPFDDDIPF